uniref:Uncharacterized protein n=1 Tax=Panagrolaimus sp. PS1159 TaxID=55785 RepID=A0AC35GEE6_9BILA
MDYHIINFYGITNKKVFFVIRDAASSIIKAIKDLKLDSFDCMCHKIQLAVNDGLSINSTCLNLFEKVKKFVRKYRKSGIKRKQLTDLMLLLEMDPLNLIKAMPVRWNSSFLMLKRFLQCKTAIIAAAEADSYFPQFTEKEWAMMELIVQLLALFYKYTIYLQHRNVSIANVLPVYYILCQRLSTPSSFVPAVISTMLSASPNDDESDDTGSIELDHIEEDQSREFESNVTLLNLIAETMLNGLSSRMAQYVEDSKFVVATVLDPRFKFQYFPNNEATTYSSTDAAKARNIFDTFIETLYPSTTLTTNTAPVISIDSSKEIVSEIDMDLENFQKLNPKPVDTTPSPLSDEQKLQNEIFEYLKLPLIPFTTCPYSWWHENEKDFKQLSM